MRMTATRLKSNHHGMAPRSLPRPGAIAARGVTTFYRSSLQTPEKKLEASTTTTHFEKHLSGLRNKAKMLVVASAVMFLGFAGPLAYTLTYPNQMLTVISVVSLLLSIVLVQQSLRLRSDIRLIEKTGVTPRPITEDITYYKNRLSELRDDLVKKKKRNNEFAFFSLLGSGLPAVLALALQNNQLLIYFALPFSLCLYFADRAWAFAAAVKRIRRSTLTDQDVGRLRQTMKNKELFWRRISETAGYVMVGSIGLALAAFQPAVRDHFELLKNLPDLTLMSIPVGILGFSTLTFFHSRVLRSVFHRVKDIHTRE